MAGYVDERAKTNAALAVWGIQMHTPAQTFINDVAVQRLLPCIPLHVHNISDTCALQVASGLHHV
jgi:hypothetical protein